MIRVVTHTHSDTHTVTHTHLPTPSEKQESRQVDNIAGKLLHSKINAILNYAVKCRSEKRGTICMAVSVHDNILYCVIPNNFTVRVGSNSLAFVSRIVPTHQLSGSVSV